MNAPKMMKTVTALSGALMLVSLWLHRLGGLGLYWPLSITFGTIFYHFGMRLTVGTLFQKVMGNHADYTRKWFRPRSWESGLYRRLRVKQWKNKAPTYDVESFSPQKHTWDEIAQAMCQSELDHEVNAVLSLCPIAASRWFGSAAVFWITSVLAAAFDLSFAVIQRYNRPRILKIASMQNRAGTPAAGAEPQKF